MISKDGEWILCEEPACKAKAKNHRWGQTKAVGWFFSRDGKFAYCPDHQPEFVQEWRRRKGKK